jgi:hypothetical protein
MCERPVPGPSRRQTLLVNVPGRRRAVCARAVDRTLLLDNIPDSLFGHSVENGAIGAPSIAMASHRAA